MGLRARALFAKLASHGLRGPCYQAHNGAIPQIGRRALMGGATEPPHKSFPRRRESSAQVVPAQAGIQWSASDDWVPACAGMTN